MAALLGGAIAFCALPGTALGQAGGSKVVFSSKLHGNHDIYIMNPDGSDRQRLTDDPAADEWPELSPSGTRIVFSSYRTGGSDIYIIDVDGDDLFRLTDDPGRDLSPSWSPDETAVVFRSDRDGNGEIYRINVDRTGEVNLTNHPDLDQAPDWSHDGSRIAFMSTRTNGSEQEVYVMDASDGGDVTPFTTSPGADDEAHWSPDDSQLVFWSQRTGSYEVWLMDTVDVDNDGNGDSPTQLTFDGAEVRTPDWSPDGLQVAFASTRQSGSWNIWTMDAGGGNLHDATNDAVVDEYSSWGVEAVVVPPTVAVLVDIRPGSDENRVQRRSRGVLPVAILSTLAFDASAVDGSTIRLGPNAAAPAHGSGHFRDVDDDGMDDWVGHFRIRKIGLERGMDELLITGMTTDGRDLEGRDAIDLIRHPARRRAPSLSPAGSSIVTWGAMKAASTRE